MIAPAALAGLLIYAILTIGVTASWAWGSFQAGLFTLAAVWAAVALVRNRLIRGSLLLVPLAGVLLLGLAQALTGRSIYRWATWTALLTWTTWAIVFFLSLQICRHDDARRWFLRAAAVFGAVLCGISMLGLYTAGGRIFWLFPSGYNDFVLGPFVNRNQYAAFVELLLPIVLAESLHDRKRRIGWWLTAGAMYASVIASASRAGVLLASLEIAVVLAIGAARRTISRRLLAGGLLIVVVFTGVVGWDGLRKRFDEPDLFGGRREMNISSLHMIRDRPWTGFGLGTWPIAYPRYALYDDGSFVNQAHNDWAQWTVEGGIPFVALLAVLAVMSVRPAIDSVWGIGILCILAHGLVDYPFQQRPALGAWCFALLGTLAASTARISR
jgi:O-antigen ligase